VALARPGPAAEANIRTTPAPTPSPSAVDIGTSPQAADRVSWRPGPSEPGWNSSQWTTVPRTFLCSRWAGPAHTSPQKFWFRRLAMNYGAGQEELSRRRILEFRMIFCVPAALHIIERALQFLPADLAFDNLGQECAALAFPKELIDIAEQTFRQEDMGAFLYHEVTPLMVD